MWLGTRIKAVGVQVLYSFIDLFVHAASHHGSSNSLKSISTVTLAIANFEALFALAILWVRVPFSPSRAVPLVPSVVQVSQILSSHRLKHSVALAWLRPGLKCHHSVVCALVGVRVLVPVDAARFVGLGVGVVRSGEVLGLRAADGERYSLIHEVRFVPDTVSLVRVVIGRRAGFRVVRRICVVIAVRTTPSAVRERGIVRVAV